MAGGVWNRFQSLLFGGAIGAAASDAIAPALEPAKQHAWSKNTNRVLDLGHLAELVATGAITQDQASAEARKTGFNANRVRALIYLALEAPPVTEARELRRRGKITPAQFEHALEKAGIERQYWEAIEDLTDERLDPSVVAVAVQRGLLPNKGILPVGPPTHEGKVPPMPGVNIDPFTEAASSGIDDDRLKVLARIVGLPASPDLAARMTFREIIDRVDFDRAVSEGNTRNEWAPFLFDGFREIPSARDGIQGKLRGWIDTDAEMYAQTARHGMSKEDTDLLFKIHGRPPSWHQIWIGLQRGGKFDGPIDMIDPAFLKGLRESDLRPEWYNLLWHSRYNYPSPFVLRSLTQAGDILQPETEQVLSFLGWEPGFAKRVSTKWARGSGGAREATSANLRAEYEGLHITRPELLARLEALGYSATEAEDLADLGDYARVKKYRDAVMVAVHKAYIGHELQAAEARAKLIEDRITPDAADELLKLWALELSISRKTLSDAQIVAAYRRTTLSAADATAELVSRGYSPHDAAVRLGLTPVP